MQVYQNTQAMERPNEFEINPLRVFVAKNIKEVEEQVLIEDEVINQTCFVFDLYEYTPEEYIGVLQDENNNLQQEVLDTQMALCDVYELLEG